MISPISKRYLLLLVLLTISLPAFADDSLPTAEKINQLAQEAKGVSDLFFIETSEIRMQYEYSGRFLNQKNKDTFCKAVEKASAELERIAKHQNYLKQQIENYHGDDWEALFGQTGLWRKVAADLVGTQTSKLEIDSYVTITNEKKADCPLSLVHGGCASIKTSMEKIRCFGPSESTELDVLSKTLTESECKEDPETLLLLAILQSKYAPNALLTTLSRSPQTVIDLGKLILADLSSGGDFNSLNPVIADLAAYSAWKTDPVLYKEPLLDLAEMDKFKTPIVLYATGEAIADSEPNKAITLLIDAGMMQQKQKSMLLDVEPFRIAEQVIGLVYNSFAEKEVDCRFAIDAFDFFASVASDKMTEEKRYLYGWLLLECGKTQEAAQTFARLANTNDTVWRDKANLEILKIKINAGIDEQTLPQLRDFIINCTGQDEQKRLLRLEAMDIYCRTMLSSSITDSPAKVLDLLDAAERTPGLRYDLFRAQALYQSGRLEESARYMSKAIMEDGKSSAVLAAKIASDIVDEIELWQKDANDFNELLRNCAALADFAHKSTNTPQTNLLFAETSILQGKIFLTPFSPDENDVTWLRVQARLLMTQGKFDQSAKIWARIADLRRNEPGRVNQKSYGWWQAKFYELDCLAKSPSADRQNIAHAIDVLISSNPEIPAPWAEKLDILKQHCAAN